MKAPDDRLFHLLPPLYHDADAEQGYPLRDLLRVIAEQVGAVDESIFTLGENWFIETCEDWAVPYLGELVGYRPVLEMAGEETESARALARIFAPRRDVANTIRYRRRKGTLAVLEELARDVAGWPARAVEWRPGRGFLDVRAESALDLLGSPFEETLRSVEARDAAAITSPGRHNAGDVLLFLWRLRAFPVTRTQARGVENHAGLFTFSALGNDAPLFAPGLPEPDADHIAGETDLPSEIRRRPLEEVSEDGIVHASSLWYGNGRAFSLSAPNWPDDGAPQPIPREQVLPADLSGWAKKPPRGFVAVDPRLGRIRFPDGQEPEEGVRVSYHYGFAMPMGGGEYPRAVREPAGAVFYRAHDTGSLEAALKLWEKEAEPDAVIELTESGVYRVEINLDLTKVRSLQIRAAAGKRPILRHDAGGKTEFFRIRRGGPGKRLVLDGLLFTDAALRLSGPDKPQDHTAGAGGPAPGCPFEILIRHCTLVPGIALTPHCEPLHAEKPSLLLRRIEGCVRIEESILGTIEVEQDAARAEPVRIELRDTILDSAGAAYPALNQADDGAAPAYAVLRVARSTVFGGVLAHGIESADDSIFTDPVLAVRRQAGCVRFCHVPASSRTPHRYRCQPDLAAAGLNGEAAEEAARSVIPQFVTRRYGRAEYARLAEDCPAAIHQGAEDEGEMGVYHDLFEPQRAANLRARLAEFTPADVEPGLVFINPTRTL